MAYVPRWSNEPADRRSFTQKNDRVYTRFARWYDLAVKALPIWKTWLARAIPHARGPDVLEVSFGTGYLLTRLVRETRWRIVGVDYNRRMAQVARRNLGRRNLQAHLACADVAGLPIADGRFDTVLSTMAFSGYPDGRTALAEMVRVLKPQGRIVLIDVGYPDNGHWLGCRLVELWKRTGDIVRDLAPLFAEQGLTHEREHIGGFGSVHLYVASRASAHDHG